MADDEQDDQKDEEVVEQQPEEQPPSDWHYDPEETAVDKSENVTKATKSLNFTWRSTEFISHEKSSRWYLTLISITIVGAALTYLVMHDLLSVFIIIIVAIIFGVVAGRQPRELEYTVGSDGIKVQQQFRSYKDFKSYALIDEGELAEVIFMPLKRFSPPLTIYFDSQQAEDVMPIVSDHLPLDQEKGNDVVDRFIRNIKF